MTDKDEMTEQLTVALANFKGTFFFERVVNLGNYESRKVGISVQFDYAPGTTFEDFLAVARDAATKAKSVVYEQQGIKARLVPLDGGGQVLMEILEENFPGAVIETEGREYVESDVNDPNQKTAPATPPHPNDAFKGLDYSDPEYKSKQKDNKSWAAWRFETHPGEFKDNRAAKANGDLPSGRPDYEHKKFRAGFYSD